ncbi:MAG: hypothetical protein K2X90_01745 [Candidatus Babeliaceae bacterium]|nr:hypothetical protein [Candidatus Babeliaceae bacterium]
MKSKSFVVFFLLLFKSISSSPLESQDPTIIYQAQAQEWAEKVINRVDRYFLTDLLDLLHASYVRSYMTLVVQRDYIQLFSQIGSGWKHIINTRLNPSKDEAFDESVININNTLIQQLETFQKNCVTQKEYVEKLNRLTDDSASNYPGKIYQTIDYRPCRLLIDELRDNSRTVVAESLIEVMDEIQQEIQKAHQAVSQAAELFKNEGQLKSNNFVNRSITELLWYYVPHLMVKSFVNFDNGYTSASNHCLDAYFESQQTGNAIWHRIEVARAAYYAAHYHALYMLIKERLPEIIRTQNPSVIIQQLIDYSCSI